MTKVTVAVGLPSDGRGGARTTEPRVSDAPSRHVVWNTVSILPFSVWALNGLTM
jgi:hypothetical protein